MNGEFWVSSMSLHPFKWKCAKVSLYLRGNVFTLQVSVLPPASVMRRSKLNLLTADRILNLMGNGAYLLNALPKTRFAPSWLQTKKNTTRREVGAGTQKAWTEREFLHQRQDKFSWKHLEAALKELKECFFLRVGVFSPPLYTDQTRHQHVLLDDCGWSTVIKCSFWFNYLACRWVEQMKWYYISSAHKRPAF